MIHPCLKRFEKLYINAKPVFHGRQRQYGYSMKITFSDLKYEKHRCPDFLYKHFNIFTLI